MLISMFSPFRNICLKTVIRLIHWQKTLLYEWKKLSLFSSKYVLKLYVSAWIRLIHLQKDFSILMKNAYSHFSNILFKSSATLFLELKILLSKVCASLNVLSLWMNKAYSYFSHSRLKTVCIFINKAYSFTKDNNVLFSLFSH